MAFGVAEPTQETEASSQGVFYKGDALYVITGFEVSNEAGEEANGPGVLLQTAQRKGLTGEGLVPFFIRARRRPGLFVEGDRTGKIPPKPFLVPALEKCLE